MKKLINAPASVVRELLEGSAMLAPGVRLLADENVIIRADLPPAPAQREVAVLSGGGSGHEPAHAGYVGNGMLTAAIAGDVFTSPSSDAVLAAIRAVSGPAGALLIIKNYTGDRLNFGLAAELARSEGIAVETVVVADDVALRETVPRDRRRGIAGTVLVHKVAGAAAQQGRALAEVAQLAQRVADSVRSLGISLGPCTLPAVGKPGFVLGENEIEVGLGIHGEPGVARRPLDTAEALCGLILEQMHADRPLSSGQPLALLVNGLGATPPMELAIVARTAIHLLQARGLTVTRVWCGTLLSALDMPGFSLSILPLDDELIALLDAPTTAAAWPGGGRLNPVPVAPRITLTPEPPTAAPARPSAAGMTVHQAARRAAQALISAQAQLTELDALAGDGDLGISMTRGAQAVLALPEADFATPEQGLSAIAHALRRAIAGSSGPFYATALLRAARELAAIQLPSSTDWANAFNAAVQAVAELGGAAAGDRTMLDALIPASRHLAEGVAQQLPAGVLLENIANAADTGAQATTDMFPRMGRASYLGQRAVGHPDGGAVAVAIWLRALIPETAAPEV